MGMHAGIFVSPLRVQRFSRESKTVDPPSSNLAVVFFLSIFHYASMALFVEHTALLVGNFYG